jgi:choline transport protein
VSIAPFLVATQIQGLLILNDSEYTPERWHLTLFTFAIILIPLVVNIFARRLLAPVEILGGIFHLIFLPAILVPLIILAPRNPDSFVWSTFISGLSGWKSDGIIWSLGLLSVTFPLGSKFPSHSKVRDTNPQKALTASFTCLRK